MSARPFLEVEDLVAGYAGSRVLDGVSLSVARGEDGGAAGEKRGGQDDPDRGGDGSAPAEFLDEPSDGLAPSVVDQVGEVLRDLTSTGIAMLIVEQDLNLAFDVAGRVNVMSKGRSCMRAAWRSSARTRSWRTHCSGSADRVGTLRSRQPRL